MSGAGVHHRAARSAPGWPRGRLAVLGLLAAAAAALAAAPAGPQDVPAPLPPPLPVPEEQAAPEVAPDEPALPPGGEPDDPLELLWSHRLVFGEGGAPVVTIRLMDGQREIAFRPRARAVLRPRRGPPLALAAGERYRVRAVDALPAAVAWAPLLGEAAYGERRRLDATRRLWEGRGVTVQLRVTGGVYGVSGRVVDNRRVLMVAPGDGSERAAREFGDRALTAWGGRTGLFSEVVRRPGGRLELWGPGGRLASGDALLSLEVEGDQGFTVEQVEHDLGPAHGREDRAYRGKLHVTLDASGRLAAVLAVSLEELLRGLVPSEIPAGSPGQALRAQAVTARSNVLAQLGTRHLTEPYVLCSEVHCQAYRGEGAQTAATDQAVRATRGEAIFRRADRSLVNAVYSALCGGHGEDNDAVWPTLSDPSLRGQPDLPGGEARAWAGGLADGGRLRTFLEHGPVGWCGRATGAPRDRYRWRRKLTRAELDAYVAGLGVGHVTSLEVTGRGASGRARALRVEGDAGATLVEGELRIRKLLGNLPSAMFVLERDGADLALVGGGWGHGVGMCQWGAVGRAEAGQDYREILRAYYSGAEVARIY